VVETFVDKGESAKTADRPEFQKMMRFCTTTKHRINHVVVYRLDRLARNSYDSAIYGGMLAKYNVKLLSTTEPISDDPTGRFMQTVLSAIAELDNDIRGQRAKDGMTRVAEKGGWAFQAPLGYISSRDKDDMPVLEVHPQQAPMIRKLYGLIATGLYTISQAHKEINRRGWKKVFGRDAHIQTVHKVLTNPIMAGQITGRLVDGKVIKARFKGLIEQHLFDKVQTILAGKGHVATPHSRNNENFPLRTFVKCSKCGKPLTASLSTGRAGDKYPYYRCQKKDCLAVHIKKTALEDDFRDLLSSLSDKVTPQFKTLKDNVLAGWKSRHDDVIIQQAQYQAELESLQTQQRILLDKLVKGIITDDAYKAMNQKYDAEIAICRVEIHDAQLDELDIDGVLNAAEYMFSNLAVLWDSMELNNRQRFQLVLFPSGLAYSMKDKYGTNVTSPVFNVLQNKSEGNSRMARPRGIEPR